MASNLSFPRAHELIGTGLLAGGSSTANAKIEDLPGMDWQLRGEDLHIERALPFPARLFRSSLQAMGRTKELRGGSTGLWKRAEQARYRNWTRFAVDDGAVAKVDPASRIVAPREAAFGSGAGSVRP